jgi:hypothetical protein
MDCAEVIAVAAISDAAVRERTFPVNLNMFLSVELTPLDACDAVTGIR